MKRLLIALILVVLSIPVRAESIRELVELALKNNDILKSISWEERVSFHRYKEAKGWLYPRIWLEGEGIRSNNPPFVWMSKMSRSDVTPEMMNLNGFNDPDAVTNFSSSVNIAYTLFKGGAISNAVKIQEFAHKMSQKLKDASQEEIAFQVVKTYLETAWLKSRVKAAKSFVESAKYHLKQAESRYKAQVALKADVLKAKVHLAQAKERLIKEKTSLDISERKLSILIGKSPEQPTAINDDIESLYLNLKGYTADINSFVQEALSSRKDLQAQELQVKMAEKGVKVAKAEYFPEINLLSSFSWYGHNYPFQGEQSSWSIGGVIKFNIFDGFSREHKVKKAKAEKLRAWYRYLYKKKEVSLEVISSIKQIEDAKQRVILAQNSVREAEENLRVMEKRYQQGLATITELTDSQRYLEESKSMYLGALYNYLLAIYRAELSKGTLLKFIGVQGGKK